MNANIPINFIEEIIAEGRKLACPGDAKDMVGKPHNIQIVNKYDSSTLHK